MFLEEGVFCVKGDSRVRDLLRDCDEIAIWQYGNMARWQWCVDMVGVEGRI